MATHSSILTWRIPWTEEPGGPCGCKESNTAEHTDTASTTTLWCVELQCCAQETYKMCSTKVTWIKKAPKNVDNVACLYLLFIVSKKYQKKYHSYD